MCSFLLSLLSPILSIIRTIISDTMINFTSGNNGHRINNVTCFQWYKEIFTQDGGLFKAALPYISFEHQKFEICFVPYQPNIIKWNVSTEDSNIKYRARKGSVSTEVSHRSIFSPLSDPHIRHLQTVQWTLLFRAMYLNIWISLCKGDYLWC